MKITQFLPPLFATYMPRAVIGYSNFNNLNPTNSMALEYSNRVIHDAIDFTQEYSSGTDSLERLLIQYDDVELPNEIGIKEVDEMLNKFTSNYEDEILKKISPISEDEVIKDNLNEAGITGVNKKDLR